MHLPLHPGKCPPWLFGRMKKLSKALSELIIFEYGSKEFLRRLSDPLFFQSMGCVLGFDWHSSGLTTTVCGAMKEALADEHEVAACGGKGKTSKKAPFDIEKNADRYSLSDSKTEKLKKASKMTAKVDSSCVQDGYGLYHHIFFMDEKGGWTVVQQGLSDEKGWARRYHWYSTDNFVENPEESIMGDGSDETLNLVGVSSEEARKISVDLVKDNPARLRKYFTGQTTLFDNDYKMPKRHEILGSDLSERDWKTLGTVHEHQPRNYEELVSLRGVGKKKLRALALISKLVYGSELDWKDPVK